MRNPGKGRLLTFEPSSGNWRKNLGTDIRNGSVKRYPIIGIPFGLRPHSIPIMGNDTVNGILPKNLEFVSNIGYFDFSGDSEKFTLYTETDRLHSAFQFVNLIAFNISIVYSCLHQITDVYTSLLL